MTETAEAIIVRIHLGQGDCRVTADAQAMMTTVLGSCIAACMRDPVAKVGGMNHFLLPEGQGADGSASLRYGAHSMELLVNGLLTLGARRDRLEAKIFGGARLTEGLTDIGEKNAQFAERYLNREGIRNLGGDVGGRQARRLQFWPVSGRVRQMKVVAPPETVIQPARPAKDIGAVEFF
jgi:chemotaxis protein CheD